MSFLAGFGEAFHDSYERSAQRTANREDDLFKMQYNDLMKHKEERRKLELKQKNDMDRAQTIYDSYGQGLPENAVNNIYDQVKAGYTNEQIQEYLQTHSVKPSGQIAQPQTTIAAGTTQSASSVDNPTAVDTNTTVASNPNDPMVNVVNGAADPNITPALDQAPTPALDNLNRKYGSPPVSQGDTTSTIKETTTGDIAEKPADEVLGKTDRNKFGFDFKTTQERVADRLNDATNGDYQKYIDGADDLATNTGIRVSFMPKNGLQDNPYLKGITESNLPIRLQQAQEAGDIKAVESIRNMKQGFLEMQRAERAATTPFEPYIMIDSTGANPDQRVMSNGYSWQKDTGTEVPLNSVDGFIFIKAKDYNKENASVLRGASKDMEDMKQRRGSVVSQATTGQQISAVLQGNPWADSYASGAVAFLKRVGFETQAFTNLARNVDNRMMDGYGENQMITLDGLNSKLQSFSDVDKGYLELQALKVQYTFDRLQAMGQKGNAVSAKEFERQYNAIFGSANPNKVIDALRSDTENSIRQYANSVRVFKTSDAGRNLTDPGAFYNAADPRDEIMQVMDNQTRDWLTNGTNVEISNPQIQNVNQPQTPVVESPDPQALIKRAQTEGWKDGQPFMYNGTQYIYNKPQGK